MSTNYSFKMDTDKTQSGIEFLSTAIDQLEDIIDHMNSSIKGLEDDAFFTNKYIKSNRLVNTDRISSAAKELQKVNYGNEVSLKETKGKILNMRDILIKYSQGTTIESSPFLKEFFSEYNTITSPIEYYIDHLGCSEEIAKIYYKMKQEQHSGKLKEPTHDSPKNEIIAYYMMYLDCDYETAVDIYNRDKKARGGIPQWEREKATEDLDDNTTDGDNTPTPYVSAGVIAGATPAGNLQKTNMDTMQKATQEEINKAKNIEKAEKTEDKSDDKQEKKQETENTKQHEQEKKSEENKIPQDKIKEKVEDASINDPLPPEINKNDQTIIENRPNQHQGGGYSSNNNWSNNWNGDNNSTYNPDELEGQEEPSEITPGPEQEENEPITESTITTTTIPTNLDKTNTKSASGSKVVPVLAGLGAAAAIGVGAKAYMDNKKNNDNGEDDEEYTEGMDDEIYADEWNETEDTYTSNDIEFNEQDGDFTTEDTYNDMEKTTSSADEYGEM